eukprot:403332210
MITNRDSLMYENQLIKSRFKNENLAYIKRNQPSLDQEKRIPAKLVSQYFDNAQKPTSLISNHQKYQKVDRSIVEQPYKHQESQISKNYDYANMKQTRELLQVLNEGLLQQSNHQDGRTQNQVSQLNKRGLVYENSKHMQPQETQENSQIVTVDVTSSKDRTSMILAKRQQSFLNHKMQRIISEQQDNIRQLSEDLLRKSKTQEHKSQLGNKSQGEISNIKYRVVDKNQNHEIEKQETYRDGSNPQQKFKKIAFLQKLKNITFDDRQQSNQKHQTLFGNHHISSQQLLKQKPGVPEVKSQQLTQIIVNNQNHLIQNQLLEQKTFDNSLKSKSQMRIPLKLQKQQVEHHYHDILVAGGRKSQNSNSQSKKSEQTKVFKKSAGGTQGQSQKTQNLAFIGGHENVHRRRTQIDNQAHHIQQQIQQRLVIPDTLRKMKTHLVPEQNKSKPKVLRLQKKNISLQSRLQQLTHQQCYEQHNQHQTLWDNNHLLVKTEGCASPPQIVTKDSIQTSQLTRSTQFYQAIIPDEETVGQPNNFPDLKRISNIGSKQHTNCQTNRDGKRAPIHSQQKENNPPLKLIAEEYLNYMGSYENNLLRFYLEADIDTQLSSNGNQENGYSRHTEINEVLRARLIDWVLHCTQICQMEEKNIFFIVVYLIDLYYQKIEKEQSRTDVQLTAISSIFIASKLVQISHVGLQFCLTNLGHNKFSQKDVEDRECEILRLAEWMISTKPTLYEVFELTLMILKCQLQGKVSDLEMIEFIKDFQSVAFVLLRSCATLMHISQLSLFEVVSSVITIALGFKIYEVRDISPQINEIKSLKQCWYNILSSKFQLHADIVEKSVLLMTQIQRMDQLCDNKLQEIMCLPKQLRKWNQYELKQALDGVFTDLEDF